MQTILIRQPGAKHQSLADYQDHRILKITAATFMVAAVSFAFVAALVWSF